MTPLVHRLARSVAALSLLAGALGVGALFAQERQEGDTPSSILTSGFGTLEYAGRELAVPMALTYLGPLIPLQPVVDLLGGEYEVGPLGQSHTLRLGDDVMILGPDSGVMTMGQQIIPIGHPPMASIDGLQVPVEFLMRSYGDLLGFRFEWDPQSRHLRISRREGAAVDVAIDWVHTQGITMLLVKFPRQPRYRVDSEGNELRLSLLDGRIESATPPRRVDDPLLEAVRVEGDQIRLRLAEGATAAEPYGVDRGSHYELVFDISRSARVEPQLQPQWRQNVPGSGGFKIVIDPGHGGPEHGAIGKSGAEEKELTLVLARRLKARLEQRLPVKAVLTRDADVDLPHEMRTSLANQNQADLFLSLHLNSEPWGSSARGAETYFLSMEASDELAAAAAETENRGASAGGPETGLDPTTPDEDLGLQLVLWDLAQNHHLAQSQRFAGMIQQELNEALDLRNRGVKQAPFRVLMGATMPAVLVELGFLSNPEEEQRLRDPAYRQRLVDALVRAVQRYMSMVRAGAVDGESGSAPASERPRP